MLSSRVLSRASRVSRPTLQQFCQTMGKRMASSMPNEEQSAHIATQRIRAWATSLPIEVYPLFVIMFSSLSFGVYSFTLPAQNDATLRLRRTGFRGHNSAMNWRDQIDAE